MNVIKELWHGNIIPQEDSSKGDERAAWIHGSASRGLRKELHRRAESSLRNVPRSETAQSNELAEPSWRRRKDFMTD